MASVTVDGQEYELRPVRVGVIKRLWPKLQDLSGGADLVASFDVLGEFVSASAGRPGIADELTPAELQRAFAEALKISALVPREGQQGEPAAP